MKHLTHEALPALTGLLVIVAGVTSHPSLQLAYALYALFIVTLVWGILTLGE